MRSSLTPVQTHIYSQPPLQPQTQPKIQTPRLIAPILSKEAKTQATQLLPHRSFASDCNDYLNLFKPYK